MAKSEITSLALGDLDIDEIERRIELASASAGTWGCQDCAVDCPSVCTEFLICEPNLKS